MEVAIIGDDYAELEQSGKRVRVRLTDTDDGVLLALEPVGCNLEGEMPGEYYLTENGAEGVGPQSAVLAEALSIASGIYHMKRSGSDLTARHAEAIRAEATRFNIDFEAERHDPVALAMAITEEYVAASERTWDNLTEAL